jgi:hypothetical protein
MAREDPATSAAPETARSSRLRSASLRIATTLAALTWLSLVWPLLRATRLQHHRPALYALVAAAALALGFAPVARASSFALLALPRWAYLALVAALHVAATALTQQRIGRGHTFSPDGAVYLFQARALAHGSFGTPLELPRQAWSMRFLFEGADGLLHGVFPPGWPLFLAPFVRAGAPFAAGLVIAALLSWVTYALAFSLGERERWSDDPARREQTREIVARTAALLPVVSFARAMQTTDLLSHAFVAVLSAAAVTLALRLSVRPGEASRASLRHAAALGAVVGWAFSARLLDGLALAVGCAALVLPKLARGYRAGARRAAVTALVTIIVSACPFVLLVAAHQRSATGSWTTPTQHEYFARSDYPRTCHRLGFGRDVGCEVEHGDDRAAMGPDGYTVSVAWAVARSRAIVLGDDLLSPPQLLTLAIVLTILRPTRRAAFAAAFSVCFTVAYGLFYYGNAPGFGARHLFPLAPFAYFLAARAFALPSERWPTLAPASAMMLVLLAPCAAGQWNRWRVLTLHLPEITSREPWVRPLIARAQNPTGIILVSDNFHAITGYDPWQDRGRRVVVTSDDAGLRELRRAHPSWPVWAPTANQTLVRLELPPPRAELSVELESAWPSLQWPSGLKAWRLDALRLPGAPVASGARVLAIEHARPGSRLRVSFDVAGEGEFIPGVQAFTGPAYGDYRVTLDGAPLVTITGFAPAVARTRFMGERRTLARGAHELVFECVSKDARSTGYGAALDSFVAQPAP